MTYSLPESATPAIAHHALYAAERTRLRLSRGLRVAGWVAAIPAVVTAMILLWGEFAGAITGRSTAPIAEALRAVGLAPYTQWFTNLAYGWIIGRVVYAGASSITRERERGRWELLALTHVHTRGLFFARWWAALRSVERGVWLLILVRAGVAVWLGAEFSRATYLATAQVVPSRLFPPDPAKVLLTLPLMAVFTWVTVGAAAAVGVAVSSLSRRSVVAIPAAFFAVALLYGSLYLGTGVVSAWVSSPRSGPPMVRETRDTLIPYFQTLRVTTLDMGHSLAQTLVDYEVQYNYRPEAYVLAYNQRRWNFAWWGALVTVCGVLSAAGVLAFAISQMALRRAGVLSPNAPPPRPRARPNPIRARATT